MRPMLAHYPQDSQSFGIDNQYLLGDILLVHPIMHPSVSHADVYFPETIWYDTDDFTKFDKGGYTRINGTKLEKVIFEMKL